MSDPLPMSRPHALSTDGRSALRRLLSRPTVLAFDFDGTLAPIVARPDEARMSHAVSRRLARLAELVPVAIITGRSVDDLRSRLDFVPHDIVGNHGAEVGGGAGQDPSTQQALQAFRHRLGTQSQALSEVGVTVEDKGFSLALHYRLAAQPARALHRVQALLSDLEPGLRAFDGKMVHNVVPADAPDKAEALRRVLSRHGMDRAFFAGDDVNDEPVFEAACANWMTVRVGREVASTRAQFFLDSPAEMSVLLEAMLNELAGGSTPCVT